jgi:hypothetical protein
LRLKTRSAWRSNSPLRESDDGNLDNGQIHSAHALAAAERSIVGFAAVTIA